MELIHHSFLNKGYQSWRVKIWTTTRWLQRGTDSFSVLLSGGVYVKSAINGHIEINNIPFKRLKKLNKNTKNISSAISTQKNETNARINTR